MRRRLLSSSLRVAFVMLIAALSVAVYAEEQEVSIETSDGSLVASFWEVTGEAPGILLLHDCEGDRSIYSALGNSLAQAGFRVVAPDLRGLGQEDQDGADAEAALKFLGTHPGPMIGVMGAGCGGREAIRLVTAHPEIPRVALLSTRMDSHVERDTMKLSAQKLLLIAAKGDTGASRPAGTLGYRRRSASTLKLFDGDARAGALLEQEPTLLDDIAEWFGEANE